jgi:hypothetical protein
MEINGVIIITAENVAELLFTVLNVQREFVIGIIADSKTKDLIYWVLWRFN